AGRLVDRLVVAVDGLLLVRREALPLRRPRQRGVALMNQQHVLHRFLLSWSLDASETNGGREKGQPRRRSPRFPASPRTANVTGDDVGEARMSSNRDNLTKEYATDEIVVEWEPRLCFHSHNCVRSLPQVFDERRRPWVRVDAASADEVEAAVARCPSGALRTRRVGIPRGNGNEPIEVCA